ncbi:MAG TPA: hypothetical protein DEP05_06505 [Betaproteobacteria bacterium]|nr:hypothetical protein [Betaproteobacteria bacterium]
MAEWGGRLRWIARLKTYRPDWITLILIAAAAGVWFFPPAWVSDLHRPAPAAQLTLLDGGTVDLAALRGRVVLVNFWATWCPFCRHEIPQIEKFYRDYRDKGFVVLAISTDESPETVRAFLRREGFAVPVAMDTVAIDRAFGGVTRLPTSFVIDRQGRLRHKISGQVTYDRLRRLVTPLLAS